jgi:hypothetical protein
MSGPGLTSMQEQAVLIMAFDYGCPAAAIAMDFHAEGILVSPMEIEHAIGKEKARRPEKYSTWKPHYASVVREYIKSGILSHRSLIAVMLEEQLCLTPDEADSHLQLMAKAGQIQRTAVGVRVRGHVDTLYSVS